jgi:hypothetical protein
MNNETGHSQPDPQLFNYRIVEAGRVNELAWKVSTVMAEQPHWRPLGGVAVSGKHFYQAMVLDHSFPKHLIEGDASVSEGQ